MLQYPQIDNLLIMENESNIVERQITMSKEALLKTIVESSNEIIISKTLEGIIIAWNAAAERIFGYTEAEAIGQHISLIIPKEYLDEEKYITRLTISRTISNFKFN